VSNSKRLLKHVLGEQGYESLQKSLVKINTKSVVDLGEVAN